VQQSASLHQLKQGMKKYPQHMINVPLAHPIDVDGSVPIQAAIARAEAVLGGKGRVLLRPSGTEPLIRVMVEGEEASVVREQARALARVVEEAVEARAEAG
jgi:phosphoglucosamine mutase